MALLKRLFGGKQRVVCPRCLERIAVSDSTNQRCSNCGWDLPPGYIRSFEESPPIFIQVFGWTNHGKTMFLDTLRLVLMEMNALWNNYLYESFTQLDLDKERELRAQRRKGQLAASTQVRERDQNEVYIMNLKGMERWHNRMLVIMDHPGEYFESFSVPTKEIPFLVNTPTTIMLISLPDVVDDNVNSAGESVDQLFSIYLAALEKERINFKKERRKVVVVFTKADITKGLPNNLRHYLLDDTVWPSIDSNKRVAPLTNVDVAEYLERMQRVSDEIREWIRTDRKNVPGGANFVKRIDDYNIEARFALMSATGGDVDAGGVNISPRRVLDAFFWALEFQSR